MKFAASSVMCLVLLSPAGPVAADDPLFPQDPALATPLKLELQFPLSNLLKLRAKTVEEFAGTLVLQDGTQLPVTVAPRGKSRRESCSFPPLLLDFKKKSVRDTVFHKQNKLKLVTHCASRMSTRPYLAAEMLVYRLLNMMTEHSFRVRSAEIVYVDTERERRETRPAFFIEHKNRLAKRLDAETFETPGISIGDLEPGHAALISMFAYMIGNTDYSLRKGPAGECCHNAVPVKQGDVIRPVPYDFDVSGFVNPPYAEPSPTLRIRKVTRRLYRGYCDHNAELPAVIERFQSMREELVAAVRSFDDLPGADPQRSIDYLDGFFETIASDKLVQSRIVERCL